MVNCLVTKLKSVVNDDNLTPLGYVKIASLTGTNKTLMRTDFSISNSTGVCKLSGDGYFINNNGENAGKEMAFAQRANLGPNEGIHINSGTVNIFAPYNDLMTQLNILEGDVDMDSLFLAFKQSLTPSLYIIKGNVAGKSKSILKGNYFDIENINGVGLTGEIADMELSYTSVPNYIHLNNHPQLRGRVDDLLDKIAATCADGSFDVSCKYLPEVTFNGESCAGAVNKTVTISNHTWSV